MMYWWNKRRHDGDYGSYAEASCGEHHHGRHERHRHWEAGGGEDGGSFGVRRPLRFLAWKLELDEKQVAELARVIADLKTERAQAEVDERRTLTSFADALQGGTFDESKAGEGGATRVKSAEKLRDAVLTAMRKIHAVLSEEQRAKFAYLIRTGTVSL
jgi:Spy/CpxP family protein refolding chaperone